MVAIIGIVASLAIPSLLGRSTCGERRFGAIFFAALFKVANSHTRRRRAWAITAPWLSYAADVLTDNVLGSGQKSGYNFAATPSAPGVRPAVFYATATPIITSGVPQTGTRRFGIAEDGVLRGDNFSLLVFYANEAAVKAAPGINN